MKLISNYYNGNSKVLLFDNGTKIRICKEEKSITEFPETIDLKITNKCNYGCPFCHENSTPDGKEATLKNVSDIINGMRKGTEIALGGGSLSTISESKFNEIVLLGTYGDKIMNATFKLEEIKIVENFSGFTFLNGIGISFIDTPSNRERLLEIKEKYNKKMVVHVINGIVSLDTMNWLAENNFKVLVLGYKNFRRGINYMADDVKRKMALLSDNIKKYMSTMKVISFDNLSLEQLDIKNKVSKEKWEQSYMGNEGTISMFIDAVNMVCGKNSLTPEDKRIPLKFSDDQHYYLKDYYKSRTEVIEDAFEKIKNID